MKKLVGNFPKHKICSSTFHDRILYGMMAITAESQTVRKHVEILPLKIRIFAHFLNSDNQPYVKYSSISGQAQCGQIHPF